MTDSKWTMDEFDRLVTFRILNDNLTNAEFAEQFEDGFPERSEKGITSQLGRLRTGDRSNAVITDLERKTLNDAAGQGEIDYDTNPAAIGKEQHSDIVEVLKRKEINQNDPDPDARTVEYIAKITGLSTEQADKYIQSTVWDDHENAVTDEREKMVNHDSTEFSTPEDALVFMMASPIYDPDDEEFDAGLIAENLPEKDEAAIEQRLYEMAGQMEGGVPELLGSSEALIEMAHRHPETPDVFTPDGYAIRTEQRIEMPWPYKVLIFITVASLAVIALSLFSMAGGF